MPNPWLIEGMRGLGDNLYQRAVVREIVKSRLVYLDTPWPQIYADLPVRCVKGQTTLRTQAKNLARPAHWWTLPDLVDHRRWHYINRPDVSMLQALCEDIGLKADAIDFSGPPVAKVDREAYIVVRPVTERLEWRAGTRSPRPEYIARTVGALRSRYRVISVADLCPPYEVALQPLPYADERFHRGELPVEQLLALVAGAAAVIGGVGWLAPAAVAYQVPMFLIFGGWGAANGPQRIFDARMDTSRIHQVVPDRFCMCGDRDHGCDRTISNLEAQIELFSLGLAARQASAMGA